MAEVDEVFKKILGMKGVKGLFVFSNDGIPIKTSMDVETTNHLTYSLHDVMSRASNSVKELDTGNDLLMVRLHTKKNEIMCSNDPTHHYKMAVVQEATEGD